jgi:hypothetical protein
MRRAFDSGGPKQLACTSSLVLPDWQRVLLQLSLRQQSCTLRLLNP